ncbi:MAG: hypothetical protein VX836_07235 [Pseudomonadota bacterium]|jgi:hypothetical protein|nr:hypothetical protein [Pseudomonadota bacterium]
MSHSGNAGAAAAALNWNDFPLILLLSLAQAIAGGLALAMLSGGVLGWLFWGGFWTGTLWAWAPLGLGLFVLLVIAGLLPEQTREALLEMPGAD